MLKNKKITLICVWYNEEKNLPKLIESIKLVQPILDVKFIYIDQSSSDNSMGIVSKFTKYVFLHKNRGYADPDKKWAYENLISENELTMIIDADEEISVDLAKEISSTNFQIWYTKRNIYFLWSIIQTCVEPRIFFKEYIEISDEIHNYLHPKSNTNNVVFKNYLINNDLKLKGNEIHAMVNKLNSYSNNEVRNWNKVTLIFWMVFMPIFWFFGWWIRHLNFFKGFWGLVNCCLMWYYHFLIYAKAYERLIDKQNEK